MVINNVEKTSHYPFQRPWMRTNGAASASEGGLMGLKGIIAGGITGALESTITYPTEYVKTQLQLDRKEGSAKQFSGIGDVVVKTIKTRGFLGFYQGLAVLIYGSIPKYAVRFGTFEYLKSLSVDENGRLGLMARLLCGLGAGVNEAIFAVTPMETIKVKFINDVRLPTPKYKGFFHGISTMIKEEGIVGIYKGLLPTLIKQSSNQAIRFFIVESLKDKYRKGDPNAEIPKLLVGVFGGFAGGVSVLCNNPVDVIKTRMQGIESKRYKNTWDCIVKTFQEEGISAFYKGTIPRLIKVCSDVALTFMIYDTIMEIFSRKK